MFKISFKDVGENRVSKDVIVSSKTLHKAEIVAFAKCTKILGRDDFVLRRYPDNEYNLDVCGVLLGSFTIVKQ